MTYAPGDRVEWAAAFRGTVRQVTHAIVWVTMDAADVGEDPDGDDVVWRFPRAADGSAAGLRVLLGEGPDRDPIPAPYVHGAPLLTVVDDPTDEWPPQMCPRDVVGWGSCTCHPDDGGAA